MGQAATGESVCEPLVSDHSTAGCVKRCASRGRTVPGLSQGQSSDLSPWHLLASEWHRARAGDDLLGDLFSARDALQSIHLPRLVWVGNSVQSSFCVSIFQV